MRRIEEIGQLKRITEPVSRNEEMGAITYLAHQEIGAPALFFENIVDTPRGFRALWNPIGSSVDRFALAIGEPAGLGAMELIRRCKSKFSSPIPPVVVDAEGAPVNENHLYDDKVDIRRFPAARHWARDGGEYIGTCDAIITRDPDGGWLNVGTYRQMVQGKRGVGLYLSPGKDARLHVERYWRRDEPCEVVMCWGIDPALFIAASQTFPKTVSELRDAGLSEDEFRALLQCTPGRRTPHSTRPLARDARSRLVSVGVRRRYPGGRPDFSPLTSREDECQGSRSSTAS